MTNISSRNQHNNLWPTKNDLLWAFLYLLTIIAILLVLFCTISCRATKSCTTTTTTEAQKQTSSSSTTFTIFDTLFSTFIPNTLIETYQQPQSPSETTQHPKNDHYCSPVLQRRCSSIPSPPSPILIRHTTLKKTDTITTRSIDTTTQKKYTSTELRNPEPPLISTTYQNFVLFFFIIVLLVVGCFLAKRHV